MTLPDSYFRRPIAHRGLHDLNAGRAENSRRAFVAAIESDYGIELDVQVSKDGQAMVFHDYDLSRLTDERGPVAQRPAEELRQIPLSGDGDGIPTLPEVLSLVGGRVPLLIEIKDQDGAMGSSLGPLGAATARALEGYIGDVALMSFNPHHVAEMAELCPDRPRGLVTDEWDGEDWPMVPKARRDALRPIPDYDRTGSCFVSHHLSDLDRPRVAELKAAGARILCWTVKSPEDEAKARRIVDNITFEGYRA